MTTEKSPTVLTRGLGGELRHLREERKLSVRAVAEQLGWQGSKLSRMETGKQGITVADVASLLVVYKITGKERNRLIGMAERSGDRNWWEVMGGLPSESRTVIQFETEASKIFNFQPLLMPGLLQIPEYTRALMRSGGVEHADVEIRTAARMGRQAVLTRDDPPDYQVIVDEMVLRRVIGGSHVMGKQMRRLLEAIETGQVEFCVIPFEVGGHPGLDGPFMIMDFPQHSSVVLLEHKVSSGFLEEPEQVEFFRNVADQLTEVAADAVTSADIVARFATEYERK